jgi:hypothetical protein
MPGPVRRIRRAKGVNLVDLIKILKLHRRKTPIVGLGAQALQLFDEHILASDWYPHDLLLELLGYTYSTCSAAARRTHSRWASSAQRSP